MPEKGLDFAFLRHIGVEPETQRRIQQFYRPWFSRCERVVDLACGDGDFVAMLQEQEVQAVGVDSDPVCCAAVRERGLEIVCQDVFDFLRAAPEASFDGVFSAHLVEHLPYDQVLEMVRLSWRVLKPGGVIVLVTPNVRGLYTHLESFYLHFGHVSFYHPELLCFFLAQAGFTDWEWGENPQMATPLWGRPALHTSLPDIQLPNVRPASEHPLEAGHIQLHRELPVHAPGLLGRLVGRVKRALTIWLILPYLDELVPQLNRQLARVNYQFVQSNHRVAQLLAHLDDAQANLAAHLGRVLERLDRPVECYATATKPLADAASPEDSQDD